MLNYIWGFMIVIGIIFGALNGTLPDMADAMLNSGKEAVTLCITMLGVISIWTGLMEIAQETGMIDGAAKKLESFVTFMFPDIPKGHEARGYISTNIIANMLGLGWAATPAGLRAMESLAELEKTRVCKVRGNVEQSDIHRTASKEMCTFLVLNISSLQLIPVNMIAYRGQYGSVNPTAIIMPALIATGISTIAAIIFCKCMAVRE